MLELAELLVAPAPVGPTQATPPMQAAAAPHELTAATPARLAAAAPNAPVATLTGETPASGASDEGA